MKAPPKIISMKRKSIPAHLPLAGRAKPFTFWLANVGSDVGRGGYRDAARFCASLFLSSLGFGMLFVGIGGDELGSARTASGGKVTPQACPHLTPSTNLCLSAYFAPDSPSSGAISNI